jgi:hypothetical protein
LLCDFAYTRNDVLNPITVITVIEQLNNVISSYMV